MLQLPSATTSFTAGRHHRMAASALRRSTTLPPLFVSEETEPTPQSPKKKYKKKKKKGFTINENLAGKVVSSAGIFEGRETIDRPQSSTLGVSKKQQYADRNNAMPTIVSVLVDDDYDPDGLFYKEALDAQRVAFDCEGVDLSRVGTVELVSIAFASGNVYLIDMQGEKRERRMSALKELLGSQTILKVIHDCRMDADALFHLHDIEVATVHDTSCFHENVRDNAPLNEVLVHYCLESNEVRDSSVYRENPQFWATRPLTDQMIKWASGDVLQLLSVADRQLETISERKMEANMALSKSRTEKVVTSKVESVPCFIPMGHVIGPRGANIRSLEARTNTTIFGDSLKPNSFIVWYRSDDDLRLVKEAMGHDAE